MRIGTEILEGGKSAIDAPTTSAASAWARRLAGNGDVGLPRRRATTSVTTHVTSHPHVSHATSTTT
jgi:hypothetical protein